MRVRNINASDNFEIILELYRSSYEHTYNQKLQDTFEVEDFRDFFILEDDRELIGFASIHENEITHLYLKPDYFDQGLGNLLLRAMVKEIIERGFDYIFLWDVVDNQRSLTFYEKSGFIKTDEIRDGVHGLKEGKYILEVHYES